MVGSSWEILWRHSGDTEAQRSWVICPRSRTLPLIQGEYSFARAALSSPSIYTPESELLTPDKNNNMNDILGHIPGIWQVACRSCSPPSHRISTHLNYLRAVSRDLQGSGSPLRQVAAQATKHNPSTTKARLDSGWKQYNPEGDTAFELRASVFRCIPPTWPQFSLPLGSRGRGWGWGVRSITSPSKPSSWEQMKTS